MKRCRTIPRATELLEVTRGQLRHALWRAGLINHPTLSGAPGLDWPSDGPYSGNRWDLDRRIEIRNTRLRELHDEGMSPTKIAEQTGMSVDAVREALRARPPSGARNLR